MGFFSRIRKLSLSSAQYDGICGCFRTGVTGCGLFLACSFVMDQLAEEQEVDVVMAVSAVRKSRPQFIATLVSAARGGDTQLANRRALYPARSQATS